MKKMVLLLTFLFLNFNYVFGQGDALNFANADDYVTNSFSSDYNVSEFTIEMWIYWSGSGIQFLSARAFEEMEIHTNTNDGLRFIPTDDVFLDTPDWVFNKNEWTHIAFMYDPSESYAACYINGREVQLTNNGPNPIGTALLNSNTSFLFGCRAGNAYNYTGYMDDIRFWNDIRTEDEIKESMMKEINGTESGLVFYYKLNEGSGTNAYDATSNSHDATLHELNPPVWLTSEAFNTWLGTTNSSWSVATNWSQGSVPTATDNVGIYTATNELTISGSPTVNNMLVASGSAPTLSSGVTVNGNLLLEEDLDLSEQTVTIGSDGYLLEGNGTFWGFIPGHVTTTRVLNNISEENVGGLGFMITTSANMGSTTISRYHIISSYSNPATIARFYIVTPTNNSGLNADIRLYYREDDRWDLTEEDLVLLKSTNNGSSWTAEGGTVNTTDHYISKSSVDGFSWWTAGINPPTVSTNAVSDIEATTATGNGNITDLGASNPDSHGFYWSSTNTTPDDSDDMSDEGSTSSTGAYTSSMTGLTPNTLYYIRAYATNSGGTGTGSVQTFHTLAATPSVPTVDNASFTTLDVTINENGNPSSVDYVIQETTTGNYVQAGGALGGSEVWQDAATWGTVTVTGLTMGTEYTFHVKARNDDTPQVETSFGSSASAYTTSNIPVLTTNNITIIGDSKAKSGGEFIDGGTSAITSKGVCWNTSGTPTISDNYTNVGSGDSDFESTMNSLSVNTQYYVRAYATNSSGTGYGNEKTFIYTAIPTLPEWGLIIFGSLVAFFAVRKMLS
jgi:hypothetical protein